MKHKTLLITFLFIIAFTLGCDKAGTTSQQLDNVQEKTADAARDMKDYTFAQKAEFTEKIQAQLAEINKDLDQLDSKIDESSDVVKTEAKLRIRVLRVQTAQLNKQIEVVKNATESTWDDVKSGTKKAYKELKDGFQQARQWVSDKIAP